ncbi:helix-turn-helix domain-containing protein [Chitinophaga sp. CF418]|uniref:helix-turn-helix domain-containing protein n=1 Tax=Chitinophaga sp. CF418 TaxID=1855287 RepID=UPI000914ED77|nr:helix-turn-helix domain-containing protein [Chitinophaga sp. CF418]SHN35994.1 AraC-type DNA-binding protein [Chitinophaga sp. CF418]
MSTKKLSQPQSLYLETSSDFFHIADLNLPAERSHIDIPVAEKRELLYILFTETGGGQILTSKGLIELTDNAVYCISSRQLMMISPGPCTRGYLATFTVGFLMLPRNYVNPLYSERLFNCMSLSLDNKTLSELKRMFTGIKTEYNGTSILRNEILREYLKIILMYLVRLDMASRAQHQHLMGATVINRFFELLHQYYTTKKRVSDYAELMSISANHLNYIIKKYSGRPVSYHISRQLMNEAARLALYTNKTMKEIAFDLGFDENTHFSKFFKKVHGCTFSVFRRNRPEIII